MRRSSPRALSSPRARSRRRWKTSGPREGSWVDCGFRIVDFGLGGEESAIRNRQSAITAAPAATKSRRCIHGVDVVTWPDDIRTRDTLPIPEPAKDGRVVFPGRKSQPRVAAVEVDTALTVEKNTNESVLHIRVGRQRPATVVRVADLLLVEVDKNSRLAGLWFLDVPPFPTVEATP